MQENSICYPSNAPAAGVFTVGSPGATAIDARFDGRELAAAWPELLLSADAKRGWASSATKRLIDIVIASVALLISAPVWLAVWFLNLAFDRGPLLYAHTRVGENGKRFRCYKFRTMVADADRIKWDIADESHHDDPRTFKIKRDPRVTPFGSWLRKLSIDEIPQLANVLIGDMSLVGPRPPLPAEVELYAPRDWIRLAVKPGLTCIWQVSGRSDIGFADQVEMDIDYINRQSLWLDCSLLLRTVPAVLSCRGAY